jgi:hypothetical protein
MLIGVASALLSMAVLQVASSYPPTQRPTHRILGRALLFAGGAAASIGVALTLFVGPSDHCDRYHGPAAGGCLMLSGILAMIFGVILAYAAEWAAAAIVAVIDPTAAVILSMGGGGSHRGGIVVLFGTHGVCATIAAWWSWRARGRSPAARAKASEAGRQLTAAWLILGLLIMASRGQADTGQLLTDSTLVSVFVITAITAVTGAGYTKYVEAMAAEPEVAIPRADGKVGELRDHLTGLREKATASVARCQALFRKQYQAL